MIVNKKTESIAKPKDLWKALKSLALLNKHSSCEVDALKIKNTVEHDVDSVLEGFRNCYSTLAQNLIKMLPNQRRNTLLTLLLNIMNI